MLQFKNCLDYLTRRAMLIMLLSISIMVAGCGKIISYYTDPFMEDLANSFLKQRDISLAKEGTPAFLLMLDGMIEHRPESRELLLHGAKAYSAYSAAFVGEDESERSKLLTEKARDYAFRAFAIQNRAFQGLREKSYSEFVASLSSSRKKDVPYMYYTAVSWAGWIQAHSESWDAVADLPKVQRITERLIELDETYNYGASHTFMGVLLTIRPASMGGRPEAARLHFERSIELGEGRFLPAYVMFAKSYAKPEYDERLFYMLLEKVKGSSVDRVPELTLINSIAQKEAQTMVDEVRREEYFD